MCKYNRSWITIYVWAISIKKFSNSKNDLQTHSRSLATILFDRPYMIIYSSSIVTMFLSAPFPRYYQLLPNIKRRHVTGTTPTQGTVYNTKLKHHMVNQCTKHEVSSFSRSGDILGRGGVKIYIGHVTITTPNFRNDLSSCIATSYGQVVYQIPGFSISDVDFILEFVCVS